MAHIAKHTRGASGHICAHYDRTAQNISNENVDPERTRDNYNLAPKRDVSQTDFINQRCGEVKCLNRKDVNVMCSWVITAPKELDEGELHRFFEESYKFLNNRYAGGSDKNVVSAYVHMDEVSPHLHYAFVPVVHDEKKGIEKVSAKELVNRYDLQTFHLDLEQHMAMVFGREIGILNEATKDGNKSIDELKRGSAQQKVDELHAEVQALQAEKGVTRAQVASQLTVFNENEKSLVKHAAQLRAVEGKLEALERVYKGKELTRKQIEGIKTKISRPLLGGANSDEVTMPLKDWENIKKTALMNADTKNEMPALKKHVGDLTQRVELLEREKKGLQMSMAERMEIAAFKSKFQYVPRSVLEQLISRYQPRNKRETMDVDRV